MSENPRILFVDDDAMVLSCFERMLRRTFELDTALGAAAAIQTLTTQGLYGVVVSDMRMPGMSGLELLAKVKEISPSTIGVLLSGNAYTDDVEAAVEAGTVFRVIQKPCTSQEITETLESALQCHRERVKAWP